MKDSYEQRIQNQFGAFCVKVLKNEARYIQREYARLRDQEKSLGELTASELLPVSLPTLRVPPPFLSTR